MTLSREEFDQLRGEGLSVEQIVAFEEGKKPEDLPQSRETEIRAAKPGEVNLKPMTVEEEASNQNIGALARATGQSVPEVASQYPLKEMPQMGSVLSNLMGNEAQAPQGLYRSASTTGMLAEPSMNQIGRTLGDIGVTSAIAAGGLTAPIKTAVGLATGYPVFKGLEMGSEALLNRLPKNTPEGLRDTANLGSYLGSLYAGGKIMEGVGKGIDVAVPKFKQSLASGLMNSMLRTKSKDFMWDKNPGMTLAKEVGGFNTIDQGITKTQVKLNELNDSNDVILNHPGMVQKLRNYSDIVTKPFRSAMTKLNTIFVGTNKTMTEKLQTTMMDLLNVKDAQGNVIRPRDFNMNPLEATKLRRQIEDSKIINWNKDAPREEKELASVMKEIYFGINRMIEKDAPQVRINNKKIAGLITAKKLLQEKSDWLAKQDPLVYGLQSGKEGGIVGGLAGIVLGPGGIATGISLGTAAEVALKTPAIRSRISSWLLRSSPQEIATEFAVTPEIVPSLATHFKGNKQLTSKIRQGLRITNQTKQLAAPTTTYGEGFTATNKPTYNPTSGIGQPYLNEAWKSSSELGSTLE